MNFKNIYKKIISSKSSYIIILGFIGIFLIAMSTFPDKKKEQKSKKTFNNTQPITTEKYVEKLENKINGIISKIEGVGKSKILITLEQGVETIYANSEKKATNSDENFSGKISKRDDIQKDVVIIDSAQGKQPLIVTQKEPTIKGVVVVCENADNPNILARVFDAVSKALNVSTNRISVVKGIS